jgi:hypothetical protein
MMDGSQTTVASGVGERRRGLERRVHLRFPSLLEAVCQPAETGFSAVSSSARVWDISQGGICLVSSRSFDVGTMLAMEIELAPQVFSTTLQAQVVHIAPHLEGLWLLGCEFPVPLNERQLAAILV